MKWTLTVGSWILLAAALRADDPELTPLQPPKPILQAVVVEAPMAYERVSMYDRWQYYGVDRTGHFRPRVVLDGTDARYLYNGKPYQMLPIRQRDYIPMMLN